MRIPAYRPPNVKDLGYHVAAYPDRRLVAFFMQCYTDEGLLCARPVPRLGTTLKVGAVSWADGASATRCHPEFAKLLQTRITEDWAVPNWRDLDIHHSSTMEPGSTKTRKIHFHRNGQNGNGDGLFS